jgi:hypothetical protein
VQRYGMNYVRYGALVPECSQVLGHERCLGFAPYARDADIRSKGWYEGIDTADKLKYPAAWYAKMVQESYFSVGPHEVGYPVAKPLPVVYTAGKILAAIVPLVVVLRLPWLWRSTASARLLLAIVTTYTLVLFLKNYDAYVSTAVPLSIHGRYVLPFLPLIGYLTYAALKPFVNSKTRRRFALGGTAMLLLMRLGAWTAVLKKGSIARDAYGKEVISERHRHRYEVNPAFVGDLEKAGLVFSGTSKDRVLMEIVELPRDVHPFFVATQFHPEFKARPLDPHPLFTEFIRVASRKNRT